MSRQHPHRVANAPRPARRDQNRLRDEAPPRARQVRSIPAVTTTGSAKRARAGLSRLWAGVPGQRGGRSGHRPRRGAIGAAVVALVAAGALVTGTDSAQAAPAFPGCHVGPDRIQVRYFDGTQRGVVDTLYLNDHDTLYEGRLALCTFPVGTWHAANRRLEMHLTSGMLAGCRLHGYVLPVTSVDGGVSFAGLGHCPGSAVYWRLTYYDV